MASTLTTLILNNVILHSEPLRRFPNLLSKLSSPLITLFPALIAALGPSQREIKNGVHDLLGRLECPYDDPCPLRLLEGFRSSGQAMCMNLTRLGDSSHSCPRLSLKVEPSGHRTQG
jgi:hypothetical protein